MLPECNILMADTTNIRSKTLKFIMYNGEQNAKVCDTETSPEQAATLVLMP